MEYTTFLLNIDKHRMISDKDNHKNKQESSATAKMTARCTLYYIWVL